MSLDRAGSAEKSQAEKGSGGKLAIRMSLIRYGKQNNEEMRVELLCEESASIREDFTDDAVNPALQNNIIHRS